MTRYLIQIRNKLKKILRSTTWVNTLRLFSGQAICAFWWLGQDNKNWGDRINIYLIEQISGKKVIHSDHTMTFGFVNVYTCIGSIIQIIKNKRSHIWGVGLISDKFRLKVKPASIHSVRGPLTRKKLLEDGFDCPEVYGDPVLLLPKFLNPNVEKKYKIGIVPHYKDQETEVISQMTEKGYKIIDILGDEMEFIQEVLSCNHIASSSLHGLILADAYGIPNKWVQFSNRLTGNTFKFMDYYLSIGTFDEQPLLLSKCREEDQIISECWKKNLDIDLEKLIESCPFNQQMN